MLKADAERQGVDLRSLGILSRRRQAHIKRYETPMSLIYVPLEEDEDAS